MTEENKIVLVINGQKEILDFAEYGLTFDSSDRDILSTLAPMVRERFNEDIGSGGSYQYKTTKVVATQTIFVFPNSTAGAEHATLSYLNDNERLKVFNLLTSACTHVWSKDKLQVDRLMPVLNTFAKLAKEDPAFLAHFASYAMRKLDGKDLKVVATFAATLSDADGQQFSPGSEYRKPNWRRVGQAALLELDPRMVLRVLELANLKLAIGTAGNEKFHYNKHLRTAVRKYLRYREANPKILKGVVNAELTNDYKNLYRFARLAPSPQACHILRWAQKKGYPGSNVEVAEAVTFNGLSDLEIAEKIRKEKIRAMRAIHMLPEKMSPVVAAAILEQCSGDETVVLSEMFASQGLLQDAEVKSVYTEKVKTAKNTLDRVDRRTTLSSEAKTILKDARSERRKSDVDDFGKIFMHLDFSPSMYSAKDIAIQHGSTFAEFVKNPSENFYWGYFNSVGIELPRPAAFKADAFAAALYSVTNGGGTHCLALYERARALGCTTDIYVTDQEHNGPNMDYIIKRARDAEHPDPRIVVIIDVKNRKDGGDLQRAFERNGIPVVVMVPAELSQSALITQAVNTALKGQNAILEEVMKEALLELPKWWESVKSA